ncbi:MAG: hypothetical protein ACRDB9_01425 [Cetobacterium sp.]
MKKNLFLVVLTIFLGACGNQKEEIKLVTISEKRQMISKMLKGDKKIEKEVALIKEKLKKQMEKGEVKAKNELEEWEKIEKHNNRLGNLSEQDKIQL